MIRLILKLYIFVIFLDAVLSYFPSLNSQIWRMKIKKLSDYICDPIRKKIAPVFPVDISPMFAIVLILVFIGLFEVLW